MKAVLPQLLCQSAPLARLARIIHEKAAGVA
jgi:hypothetical protein